ncbi:hypothetical protein EYB25_000216 [Talaromyces marneffei]|uniref:uncharacterized protein n=1 Tax=Talaromyces marneffei TaxID=37727 RepID=UPI0012AA5D8F|nr:uncharacterized protein EYB26_002137 [Talaromyces marneffei]KAE8555519.1 hypothetical protein EYB25_000216 [Talaromyces marneffei]QGA14483.1 hypothetical protein EYB26_002137 [Talaromyces marneffei]
METINPTAVLEISSDEEGADAATENEAQEEEEKEEEEATSVTARPQRQAARTKAPTPTAREAPTPSHFESSHPQRTVREGNMTFVFVPNTPVGPRSERLLNVPIATPLPGRQETACGVRAQYPDCRRTSRG